MDNLPSARSAHGKKFDDERAKLRRVATERGLGGLANDTKWDELINWCRSCKEYVPQYRCKCIDSDYVTRWDAEWYWHLPYPFSSVEWMDITFLGEERKGHLIPPAVIDHSSELESILQRIGLDFKRGKTAIRIFGYAPRNMEGFDE